MVLELMTSLSSELKNLGPWKKTENFLRADICKYQPERCNSEKLKILKKINKIASG